MASTKHWHLRVPSYKKVSHSHEGGGKYHEHPKMKGWGLKKNTIKLRVKSKKDLMDVPEQLVQYAIVTRVATALFP